MWVGVHGHMQGDDDASHERSYPSIGDGVHSQRIATSDICAASKLGRKLWDDEKFMTR